MGTILALAAAVLYGSADFLGGAAARRARPSRVLAVTTTAGAAVVVVTALFIGLAAIGRARPERAAQPGWRGRAGLGRGRGRGRCVRAAAVLSGFLDRADERGGPVSALASTLLPLGVAMAQGERPSPP